MTKLLNYLTFLNFCVLLSAAAQGQCGYKAQISTNNNYCVGSSLIAHSTHALQNIVWYRNGQPVSMVTGTQSLDTVPLIIPLGKKDSTFSTIYRLCSDGAGTIYAFCGGSIEKYSPSQGVSSLPAVWDGFEVGFNDMYVDPPGNIYLINDDSGVATIDSSLVLKLAAGTDDSTTVISKTEGNAYHYGIAGSMTMDCEGNIYVYTDDQNVVKWAPGSTSGVLAASSSYPNNCVPPAGHGQVWVDNAGAIFFMVGSGVLKWAPGASQATTVTPPGASCSGISMIYYSDFWLDAKDTMYQVGTDPSTKLIYLQKYTPGSPNPATIATFSLNTFQSGAGPFTMDIRGNMYLADQIDNQLFELRRSSTIDSAYAPTDTGSYYAVVTDIQGYSTVTDTIVINSPVTAPPSISITATADSVPICTPVTFTAASNNPGVGASYQWMVSGVPVGGDSTTYSNSLFADGDEVYCVLLAQDGCSGPVADTSNMIRMGINPEGAATVTIAATPKTNICSGQTVALTATVMNGSANPVFSWLINGDSTGDDSSMLIRSNFNNGDVVTCLIVSDDACGLAKSNSIPIYVSIPPVIEPGQIFTIPTGGSLTLDPVITGSVNTWAWTPPTGLSDTAIANPVANPSASVTYTLMVEANGGCGDTATILVDVYTPLAIPNAFSPDGDGKNDRFYVLGGPVNSVVSTFDVFNRWGQPVFQAHNVAPGDASAGWDGRIGGRPAQPGTYVYMVVMRFADGMRQAFKGTVEVIR